MSHTQLPAKDVIAACRKYLDARNARIQRELAELINPCIGHRGWFGFGKPATREQVEAELRDEIQWIEITGGLWARKTEQLLSLATVADKSNTLITIDCEMASLLATHFD